MAVSIIAGVPEKFMDLPEVTYILYHKILYWVNIAMFENQARTLVFSGDR
jgi:hypothetical protein